MNGYLQNLVRRGAGLPLSSTAAPRPSHGFERTVGATEPLQEVVTEQTAQHKTEDSTSFQIPATSEFSPIVNPAIQSVSHEQQLTTSPSLVKPAVFLDNSPSSVGNAFSVESEHGEPLRTSFESGPIEVLTKVRSVEPAQSRGSDTLSKQEPTTHAIEQPRVLAKAVGEAVLSSGEIPITVLSIRPADAERPTTLQFPKVAVSPQLPPEPVPIHVRVGRVEVRGPTQTSARSTPATQAPLGFVRYHRMRRYRN